MAVQAPLILKYASIAYRTMAFGFGQISRRVADISYRNTICEPSITLEKI